MNFYLPKKRGQVTVFIVIGIILLFSSALIFYIRNQITSTTTEMQVLDTTSDVPQRADPINAYTRDCLEKVAVKAIRLIGEQGGYIDFKKAGLKHRSARPTMSDMLEVAPGSGYFVPYWHHMPARDTCTLDCYTVTKVPPLTKAEGPNSIEEQLENYIAENIKACLDDFRPFKKEGYAVKEEGEPSADVTIAREDVYVELKYPLQFTKEDASSKYEKFSVRVPFDLSSAYSLALDVLNTTLNTQIIEGEILNLISIFSGRDSNMLPPIYDLTFDAGETIMWLKPRVEEKLKTILMSHIPMIRYAGTRNYYRKQFENLIMNGISQRTVARLKRFYPEFNVDLSYLAWWPSYFDIQPRTGAIIKPETNSFPFLNKLLVYGLGMNQYKFFYDVSIPVMISITYPEAFNGRGFSLNYAIEANIRQNWPVNGSVVAYSPPRSDSLACTSLTSGNITINLKNAITGEPLNNIPVSYLASSHEACTMGRTSGNGTLTSRFPSGIGGLSIELPPEYGGVKVIPVSITPGENKTFNYELYPTRELSVSVKKLRYIPILTPSEDGKPEINWTFNAKDAFELTKDQAAIINIEEFRPDGSEGLTASTFVSPNGETLPLKLLPGNYTVSIQLMTTKEYEVPETYEYVPTWLGLSSEKIPVPGFKMDSLPNGGIILDNETGLWTVEAQTLYSSRNITFRIIESDYYAIPPSLRAPDQLTQLNAFQTLSKQYRSQLEPVWS